MKYRIEDIFVMGQGKINSAMTIESEHAPDSKELRGALKSAIESRIGYKVDSHFKIKQILEGESNNEG